MSLHRKHDLGRKMLDVIYASSDFSLSVPKYKFPARSVRREPLTHSFTTSCCSMETRGKTSRLSAPRGSNPRCRP